MADPSAADKEQVVAVPGAAIDGGEAMDLPEMQGVEADEKKEGMQIDATEAGVAVPRLEELDAIVAAVQSEKPDEMLKGLVQLRKLVSVERHAPITAVVESGVLPRCLELMRQTDSPKTRFEALWVLTNIASGTSAHTRAIVGLGVVEDVVGIVRGASESHDVLEQAVWCLGNIAGDCSEMRDLVLACGAAEAVGPCLLRALQANSIGLVRNATWTASNLCRGKPRSPLHAVQELFPALARALESQDEEVLTDACWAWSYVSDGENERVQAVLDAGVLNRLVELMAHAKASVVTPALRTIGNIVTGNDEQTAAALRAGCIARFGLLAQHPRSNLRKEACWALSNIAAGSREQIQLLADSGAMAHVMAAAAGDNFDVRKEAIWAVSNFINGGSPEQAEWMTNNGGVATLSQALEVHDARMVLVALEGLQALLVAGEQLGAQRGVANPMLPLVEEHCLGRMEQLQEHENQQIYERVVGILERFFEAEGAEERAAGVAAVPGAPVGGPVAGAASAVPVAGGAAGFNVPGGGGAVGPGGFGAAPQPGVGGFGFGAPGGGAPAGGAPFNFGEQQQQQQQQPGGGGFNF